MGIHARDGQNPSPDAVMACSENDIDISKQASRQLIYEELGAADSIFVMEAYQKEYIQTFVPQAAGRLFLLGAWPGKERTNAVIEDPIGKISCLKK